MPAGYQELFIEQGTTFNTTITLDDVDGAPFNLTDYTSKGEIRKSYQSANTTAQFTITVNDPLNGMLSLGLSAANTANISAGRYVYDVFIKDGADNYTRILEGNVNILPRVTVF